MTSDPKVEDATPKCKRCGDAMELLTNLPRAGDHPPYRIFACAACSAIEWIAETIDRLSGD